MHWHISAQTHRGHVRPTNEDALAVIESYPLLAVADGMGGHQAGEIASRMIVERLSALRLPPTIAHAQQQIAQSLQACNHAILEFADQQLAGGTAGSTVVVLYAHGAQGVCLWVGDSRLYRVRRRQLEQLTDDHSIVAEMVAAGLITALEARSHPSNNIITRAVGARKTLEIDCIAFDIEPGDIFLLCSDGLINEIDDTEILDILLEHDVHECGTQLRDLCLSRAARDNLTLIIGQTCATAQTCQAETTAH